MPLVSVDLWLRAGFDNKAVVTWATTDGVNGLFHSYIYIPMVYIPFTAR